MKIPMLDLSRQHTAARTDLMSAVGRVIDHGQFILGTEVNHFEAQLGLVVVLKMVSVAYSPLI